MTDNGTSDGWSAWLDALAVGGLLLTLTTAVGVCGTASAGARAAVQLLALATFAVIAAGMIVKRRWTLAATPLWFLALALVVLPLVQMAATGGPLKVPGGEGLVESSSATWNRFSTLQWACWAIAGLLIMFAAAHSIRSVRRLRLFAATLAVVLLAIEGIGATQALCGNHRFLGLWSSRDKRIPLMLRDWAGTETALGSVGYQTWQPLEAAAGDGPLSGTGKDRLTWFGPRIETTTTFGSFVSPQPWAAVAILLAPLLVGLASSGWKNGGFRETSDWDGEAPRKFLLLAAAALLVGGAAWFADPLQVSLSTCFALFAMSMLSARTERRAALHNGALVLLATIAAAVAAFFCRGGMDVFIDDWRRTIADDLSLLQLFSDHVWLGCGLGALGDVWPLYRATPAEIGARGSGLLMFAAEGGATVLALAGLTIIYVVARWRALCDRLPGDARSAIGGVLAGLAGWGVLALLGPGSESPAVLVLAIAFLGCLARGLAGAYRLPERGLQA